MSMKVYDHVGKQPILVRGEFYEKGSTVTGTEEELAFFIQIGALVERKAPVPEAEPPEPVAVPLKKKG